MSFSKLGEGIANSGGGATGDDSAEEWNAEEWAEVP